MTYQTRRVRRRRRKKSKQGANKHRRTRRSKRRKGGVTNPAVIRWVFDQIDTNHDGIIDHGDLNDAIEDNPPNPNARPVTIENLGNMMAYAAADEENVRFAEFQNSIFRGEETTDPTWNWLFESIADTAPAVLPAVNRGHNDHLTATGAARSTLLSRGRHYRGRRRRRRAIQEAQRGQRPAWKGGKRRKTRRRR